MNDIEKFIFEINNFKAIRIIGKGFYSKVYLGYYLLSSQDNIENFIYEILPNNYTNINDKKLSVAIKSISKKKISVRNSIEYILNEKNILEKVKCCNSIAKLICTAQNKNKVFFIMEYFKNGDLFNYLNQLKFFEEDAVKFIMMQVYEILKFLHSKNIIYRDLKPENIMISDEGFIKLIDFGLAKQLNNREEKIGYICGTNEYIPPEVVRKEKYSFNFDWWGFGILMFELLVGKVY